MGWGIGWVWGGLLSGLGGLGVGCWVGWGWGVGWVGGGVLSGLGVGVKWVGGRS